MPDIILLLLVKAVNSLSSKFQGFNQSLVDIMIGFRDLSAIDLKSRRPNFFISESVIEDR
jgi:hypothetical protein